MQFVTLQQVRYFAQQSGLTATVGDRPLSFMSGAMAGAAATVASYPFDILRTTLAAQGEPKVVLVLQQRMQQTGYFMVSCASASADVWVAL